MAVKEEVKPAFDPSIEKESAMTSQVFTYSPLRFLWVMLAIAWSAFAHPFSSTVIDLTTGVVSHN
jgi:hypothetical protein